MQACTIIAANYLPFARVLAASYLKHHPESDFTVLLIDDLHRDINAAHEPFRILHLDEVVTDEHELHRMAMRYNVTELATSVKPLLLRLLLDTGSGPVLYLDPDILVLAPLDELGRLLRTHTILLTPHAVTPMPRDRLQPSETEILASGVYNLGFIGVGADSKPFLDWWWERLRRDAVIDQARMLFTDQRWVDFAPALFDVHIIRDPGYNVAYWNLDSRHIHQDDDGRMRADGHLLRFFHFSGYDPDVPWQLTKHFSTMPRVLLSDQPLVQELCRQYRANLLEAGYDDSNRTPYGYGLLPNGFPVDDRTRALYRHFLELAERDETGSTQEPPDPFNPDSADAFVAWLAAPWPGRPWSQISKYAYLLYDSRPDLRAAFSQPSDEEANRFLEWLRVDGVVQESVPVELLAGPSSDRDRAVSVATLPGANVVGYFRAELGVGEAGRRMLAVLRAAEVSCALVTNLETPSRQDHVFEGESSAGPYDVNILCVNADQTPHFLEGEGRHLKSAKYTVGSWYWELEEFPQSMHAGLAYVDEIWAGSEFTRQAIQRVTDKPVFAFPPPITVPQVNQTITRTELGLPDGFIFLFTFDYFSILQRKNPTGLIDAFTRAFTPGEGVKLVLKSINGDKRRPEREMLRFWARQHPDIVLLEDYVTAEQRDAMVALSDSYVSLHRAEGFGLTMAEAMALGKPVIATGYSGNLDFMTPETSYLVSHTIGRVPIGCDPYPAGASWAEPDLEDAARLMRHVFDNQVEARQRGQRAQAHVLENHGVQARVPFIRERFAAIQARQGAALISESRAHSAPAFDNPQPALDLYAAIETTWHQIDSRPDPHSPSRRRLTPWVRRAILRMLNHHDEHQRQVDTSILKTLSYVADAARSNAADTDARLSSLGRSLEGLQRQLAIVVGDQAALRTQQARQANTRGLLNRRVEELRREIASVGTQVATVQSHMDAAVDRLERQHQGRLTDVQERLEQVHGDITRVVQELAGLSQHTDRLTQDVVERVASIEGQLNSLRRASSEVLDEIAAVPYSSDPSALLLTSTVTGQRTLGFHNAHNVEANGRGYLDFEDLFRGTREFIKERQRSYLPLLRGLGPVLDVGCGRGELLELLCGEGFDATGIDMDAGMVAEAQRAGLPAVAADAFDYLATLEPSSIGAVVSMQVIEHIDPARLNELLSLSYRVLRPGGLLIAETVNPHSLRALKTFWLDFTHQRPIFPETILLLCRQVGFGNAEIFWPHGSGQLESDRTSQGEYAVLARKGLRPSQPPTG